MCAYYSASDPGQYGSSSILGDQHDPYSAAPLNDPRLAANKNSDSDYRHSLHKEQAKQDSSFSDDHSGDQAVANQLPLGGTQLMGEKEPSSVVATNPMMAQLWEQAMVSGQNPVESIPALLSAHHMASRTDSDKVTELYQQMSRALLTEHTEEQGKEAHAEEQGDDGWEDVRKKKRLVSN